MVAAFYGRRQSIAALRNRAGTDRQGTNLAGLVRAAESIGLRPRAVRARPEAFDEIQLPAIAHWTEGGRNHFVVVYRHGRKHVTLGDPAVGQRRVTRAEFDTHWTRTLLLVEPTPDLASMGDAALATLWGLVRIHKRLFTDALIAAVLITALALASSFFIQVLVDFIVPSGSGPTLNWLGIGMLGVLGARSAFLTLRAYLMAHLSQRIDAEIVMGYHHHILGLPLSFFSARRTGEIAARLHDAVKIRNALGGTGLAVIVDSATLAITSVAMLWIDWRFALMALAVMPVLGIATALLTPGTRRAQQTAMERGAHFEAHTIEMIDTIASLRSYRAESRMRLRGEARFTEVLDAAFRSEVYRLWASTSATLTAGLASLSLLWAGGHAVLAEELTLGQLMALYTLFGTVVGPVERLAGANQSIQEALIASERVGEILALPTEQNSTEEIGVDRSIQGDIQFEAVRFGYPGKPPVFKSLTLRLRQGECTRIAGPSGSGKSTLVRLLVRFYEPDAGKIRIDGIDIHDYSLESLRRQVVYLSQEASLLSISVADNIRLARPEATPDEVRSAAEKTGAHAFIQATTHGYQSLVGERGLSLSGGERQRLVLARAILADPAILILDEPTNHLDLASVHAVRNIIRDRQRNRKTTLLISHDSLSADRTINIDG